jgi:HD-GYP domain-containing protein (c-di-GMP phosphodiesterase class II)
VEGDRTLVEVARALRAVCGEEAVCGRYGGNEFAVIAEGVDPRFLAERVRAQVESETRVTVSVGYCRHCEATAQSDLMLLAAGMAVSQAKSGGRNRVREFEGFEMATDDEGLRRFLRGGSYAAVRALAEAVDAKDRYTRGHSQRVAEYAKELAQACGFDAGFVELVYVAGTLHDVGKIGVPDEVLNKTSRLTEGEFAQIKLHPELGERIVAQIPELRDTLPGIRSHHERYDGRGYPDGLAGEAIPLIARILTVADAFDAMTSDRSYRLGMSEAHAISQIAEGAGTHFDPDLAQRFVVLMRGREKAA